MLVAAQPGFFAKRLRELREAAGMTKYKLSKVSGVSKQTLGDLEAGISDPSWDTLIKLTRALGVSLDAFDEQNPKGKKKK